MKRVLPFIFLLISFISCKKEIIEIDANYEGLWLSDGLCREYLWIYPDGSGKYYRFNAFGCSGSTEEVHDDNITAGNKHIRIGQRKFKIITPPTYMDTLLMLSPLHEGEQKVYYFMELKKTFLYNSKNVKFFRFTLPD